MKVVGTGAPQVLTIRFRACEIGVLRDELHHRRAALTEAAVEAHARSTARAAGAGDREVEDRHGELLLISRLLDDAHRPAPKGEPYEIVGPAWLLGPVIRGAAGEAVARLATAVQEFAEDQRPPTQDQVRGALDSACAWTATLLGLDHAENHGLDL
jgi:hypothetical protein